jgi:hypothetical protein
MWIANAAHGNEKVANPCCRHFVELLGQGPVFCIFLSVLHFLCFYYKVELDFWMNIPCTKIKYDLE